MIEKLHFSIEGENKVWNKYTYLEKSAYKDFVFTDNNSLEVA